MNTEHEILNFFDINGNFLFYYAGRDFIIIVNGFLCCYNRKYHGSESCYYVSQLFDFQKNKSYNVLVTCYL